MHEEKSECMHSIFPHCAESQLFTCFSPSNSESASVDGLKEANREEKDVSKECSWNGVVELSFLNEEKVDSAA